MNKNVLIFFVLFSNFILSVGHRDPYADALIEPIRIAEEVDDWVAIHKEDIDKVLKLKSQVECQQNIPERAQKPYIAFNVLPGSILVACKTVKAINFV